MPVEIEAKMKVADHEALRRRLHEHGAFLIGDYLETNTFFDTADHALLAGGQGLRLRQNCDCRTGQEQFIITHKGPRLPGQLKNREETELAVASAPDAIALLGRLGYQVVVSFEKKRQSWHLDGCHVELDQMPYLGTYVEIEGPGEQPVLDVRRKLALDGCPLIKEAYIALLMDYLREHGIQERVIVFAQDGGCSPSVAGC